MQVSSSHAPAPAVTRRVSLNVPEQGAVMSWMRIFTGCMVLHGVISLVDIPLTIMLESLKQDICAALKLIPVLVCMWMLVQVSSSKTVSQCGFTPSNLALQLSNHKVPWHWHLFCIVITVCSTVSSVLSFCFRTCADVCKCSAEAVMHVSLYLKKPVQ